MTNNTQKKSIHWRELDVLRGLAALFMIVNHVGYETLAPNQIDGSLAGSLLFISSFAPVLFFFVTGVGYGIQSSQKKKASPWYGIVNKVIILVLADLLMHWSEGKWLGLDFLGYDQQGWGIVSWLLGTKDTPGVSYPLSPWLAYPFAGYLIGAAAMHYRGFIENHRLRVVSGLLMLGGLPAIASLILLKRG